MIEARDISLAVAGHNSTGSAQGCGVASGPVEFHMPTPPSVNTLYKNVRGKGRVKTSEYFDFIAMGMNAIKQQNIPSVTGYVLMVIGVELASKTADIDNRLKAMLDTIVKAGVIEDDRFITAIAISKFPKANGLSWVRIYPEQELSLTFHPSPKGACGGWYENAPQQKEMEDGYIS